MKKIILLIALTFAFWPSFSQLRGKIDIPDIPGYKTLKCDFHIHTVFSDGLVWPTVRIGEAYLEGLDAIAITDHIEYRPFKNDINASHNRSYEIAKNVAQSNGIILIKGSEITRNMPPGHHNAIFLTDSEPLDTPDYLDAFKAAKEQNAFIFWNHPGWSAQQPDTTLWMDMHTQLYNDGFMYGIEVVNGQEYYPEAHQWCLDKKLTFLGNTDIHGPIQTQVDFSKGEHRTMTLVFAREATGEAIKQALFDGRTAVYFKNLVIGQEKYLRELFENAFEILKIDKNKDRFSITIENKSDFTFELEKTEHDTNLVYFRHLTIKPKEKRTITVRFQNGATGGHVNFKINNFLSKPNQGMSYTFEI